MGVFGEEDSSIPVSAVNAFEYALNSNQTPNEVYIFPRVGHAFANPSNARFAVTQTRDAWNKTLAFLEKHLKSA
ncbi:MAG: dienelactone hydrolase family protein [Candidatus Diapherotrites archaeon]|nr:dienelactone hydrolase family protein [Candidatus Diapherotrites archaeon]